MRDVPKVSVITITYNHQQYIRQALDGFLAQRTDFEFEVIVADDCSPDSTQKIIAEYAKDHAGVIKPILRKKNIGAQANFLDALRRAKGEYIALCEGDDFWTDPTKLQRQVDFLDQHPDYALCFHPVRVSFENGEEPDTIFPENSAVAQFTLSKLLERNFIQTNSVVYRRQAYDDMHADVLPLDWYLHVYHAKFGKIGFIDRVMSTYRRHPGGIWWEAASGHIDEIWKKYGIAHLRLFIEMDSLLAPSKYPSVQEHIYQMYDAIIRTDITFGQNQLLTAIRAFPETTERYIKSIVGGHEQAISDLRNHADEQAKIISHIENANIELQIKVNHPIKTALRTRLGTKPSYPA